ncbi:adenosine monophosphate-protein transferase FICD [Clonorchis sinensis]|uniref:protein adenylyltransferase n=1 Tax=Clonorchis sinensis TaxID=79923 RepID=H2KQV4_CLOSI|nr:adenosine monophosphate-protein transferase FICD [Clonorchis sinensis]
MLFSAAFKWAVLWSFLLRSSGYVYFIEQEAYDVHQFWACRGVPSLKAQRVLLPEEATEVYYSTLMSGRFPEDKYLDPEVPPASILTTEAYLEVLEIVLSKPEEEFGNKLYMTMNCHLFNNMEWYDKFLDGCVDVSQDIGCGGSNPCVNGGRCVTKLVENTFGSEYLQEIATVTCECPPAFRGEFCELETDRCVEENVCGEFACLRDPHDMDNGYSSTLPILFTSVGLAISTSLATSHCRGSPASFTGITSLKRERLRKSAELCELSGKQLQTSINEKVLGEQLLSIEAVDDWSTVGLEDAPFLNLPSALRRGDLQAVNWPRAEDLLFMTLWIYAVLIHIALILLWIYYIHRWHDIVLIFEEEEKAHVFLDELTSHPVLCFGMSRRVLLLIFCVLLVICLLLPITVWEAFVEQLEHTLETFNWQRFLTSTTLYRLFEAVRTSADRSGFLHPNMIRKDAATSDLIYRDLIHEVVRLHRSQRAGFAHPSQTRMKRLPSSSMFQQDFPHFLTISIGEKSEARQALLAARVHQNSRQYLKARKLLQHAFRLDPNNLDILIALGEAIEGQWRTMKLTSRDNEKCYPSSLVNVNEQVVVEVDDLLLTAEHLYTRALIVDPKSRTADQSKERLMALVEEIDQRRFNVIDMKVKRFYEVPESNPGLRQAKMEHYFKHVYHSNAIEGNTLTLAQTRSILETRLAVGGKSLMEQNEVLGLDAALRYMNATLLLGKSRPITLDIILELHRLVLAYVDPSEAGRLRRTQVFIADHQPPPPDAVPQLMLDLVDWLNSEELLDVHPIELAALTHWKLVYIHPFYDGNGRTARLLMNFILMRAGLPPAIIRFEDRPDYYEHLKTANDGDVRPFIRFIATCTERTIDEYLNAALGTTTVSGTKQAPRIESTLPLTTDYAIPAKCLEPYHISEWPGSQDPSADKHDDAQVNDTPVLPSVPHRKPLRRMVLGQPAAFVSFYRRLLCDHSTKLTKHLVEKGFGLLGLADDRLMEAVYRIMRDLLNTRAPITLAQFHSPGFTERKLEMASMLTERLCSLLPTKLSQKSGPQRSTSTSGNPNRVTEVRSLPVHDHVQRVRKCHSIPQVLPDVLPPTSNPGADYALDRVTIKSSDGTGRLLDARQFLHTEIGSTAFPESRVSGDCNDTNDNQFQKPAVTFDTHVWGEESHNQITQPNGKTGNRIAKQQENQCSTFSAMIDSVGQMNQSQRLQSECSGYSMPYAKTGNSYYLLNSNPRPYCYSSSVPKTGKPAPLSNNRPPVKRTALAARTTISSTPSSRMSSSFHRWPSGQAPPTEDEPEAPAMTPPRNPMEEILTSLSKLTGKVDTMLTRLTSLELRLPRVDRGLSTARFCESASGIEETVQSSSNFLYTQANIAHNQPNDKRQKQVSADFPIHANATSLPVSPNQPSAQPNFQLDPYLGRFKKPALFRYTDSFEYSANNSLENLPPSSRSVGAGNESADFELASHVSDAYRAQVDRITTMLAETQGLLEAQHMKVVNRAA